MKQSIILVDAGGYHLRAQNLIATGYPVYCINENDAPAPDGFLDVTTPRSWMPTTDPAAERHPDWIPLKRAKWWKANLSAIALAETLDDDAYFIIESDCAATPARWKVLFDDHADSHTDIATTCQFSRATTPHALTWRGAPDWCRFAHLGAIFRLTRAAVQAIAQSAEEMREVFSEAQYLNAVIRAGGSTGPINRSTTHMNMQTMKSMPERVILNRKLVNHPIKANHPDFP